MVSFGGNSIKCIVIFIQLIVVFSLFEMISEEGRTFEEIDNMLILAKLDKNELLPLTQTINFNGTNIYNNNLRFLQLDKSLLKDIEEGQTLMFKGDPDENAVLCSKSKTFDVNDAETSNSLLLMNNLKSSEECRECNEKTISRAKIHGIFYSYLEVIPGKPYLKKVEELLNDTIYDGPEHEYNVDKTKLLTFTELDARVQSSTEELKQILEHMDVITVDNKIRLLSFKYHFRVLSYLLKLIDENSWEMDEVDFEVTIDSLKDIVPKDILVGVFEKYTEESKIIDGQTFYSYKEREVCKFFAKILLSQKGKFILEEFLGIWRNSVPEGMYPDESMLHGIAIIDDQKTPHYIWAFSEKDLPQNINERFKILFDAKERWTVPEIAPYISKLATDKLDVKALLSKYARAFKINGIQYFCAKHSK